MRSSKYVAPYVNGRTTFPTRKRPGVYLIRYRGALRYVGYSRVDVYKALYRHFQQWDDRSRAYKRATYPRTATVRLIYCNAAQAARLERALILKHQPTDNPNQYEAWEIDDADRRIIALAQEAPPF